MIVAGFFFFFFFFFFCNLSSCKYLPEKKMSGLNRNRTHDLNDAGADAVLTTKLWIEAIHDGLVSCEFQQTRANFEIVNESIQNKFICKTAVKIDIFLHSHVRHYSTGLLELTHDLPTTNCLKAYWNFFNFHIHYSSSQFHIWVTKYDITKY